MGDPQFGKAGQAYKIIKQDDPNFGVVKGGGDGDATNRTGYDIGADVRPTYAMPSGPGFEKGDIAGGKRRKLRTFPRGILRKTNKIVPSKNPSKAPPTRKRSVLLVSEKKLRDARKSAKSKAMKTDIGTIRKKLVEKKIITAGKKDVPSTILRTLYADAVGAGLLN